MHPMILLSFEAFRITVGKIAGLAMFCLLLAACGPDESGSSVKACIDGGSGLNLGFSTLGDSGDLDYGFYSFFAPVSYSEIAEPGAPEFQNHRGYEADLLTALEAIDSARLSFSRRPIPEWDGIWLRSSSAGGLDMVGGGITILNSRTRDHSGQERVQFTSGHIAFRQSLLVRAEDADRLNSYDALTSDVRIGALPATTGEARLLQLVGIADADGMLVAGTRIETAHGDVTTDGSLSYFITAANESPNLAGRKHLYPPSESMPQVVYLGDEEGEEELLDALFDDMIDGVARGEIGNSDAFHASGGAFAVSVLDDKIEWGGFTLSVEDDELATCIDEHLNYLTDNRRIGYAEWRADPNVFLKRTEQR